MERLEKLDYLTQQAKKIVEYISQRPEQSSDKIQTKIDKLLNAWEVLRSLSDNEHTLLAENALQQVIFDLESIKKAPIKDMMNNPSIQFSTLPIPEPIKHSNKQKFVALQNFVLKPKPQIYIDEIIKFHSTKILSRENVAYLLNLVLLRLRFPDKEREKALSEAGLGGRLTGSWRDGKKSFYEVIYTPNAFLSLPLDTLEDSEEYYNIFYHPYVTRRPKIEFNRLGNYAREAIYKNPYFPHKEYFNIFS